MSARTTTADRPRLLVTGPRGQVGWELRRTLGPLGEVVCCDRNAPDGRAIDLADPDSIRRAVRALRPSVIVNAAAYTAVDDAESHYETARAVNGTAPGVLAEEAARIGAAVIHYSTDYVFNGTGTRPWSEGDAVEPLNAYGRSKSEGEEAIRAAGPGHLILRVCWVYGPRGRNFLRTMLRLGRERDSVSVVADQYGAPTSARAIAEATAAILARSGCDVRGRLSELGGTLHLCCDGETTWHRFASEIFEEARNRGQELRVEEVRSIATSDYPTPARRPANSRLDCSALTERLGIALPDWHTVLRLEMDDLFGERSLPP